MRIVDTEFQEAGGTILVTFTRRRWWLPRMLERRVQGTSTNGVIWWSVDGHMIWREGDHVLQSAYLASKVRSSIQEAPRES